MRIYLIIALLLVSSALLADVATIPANLSSRGVADWVILGGGIGSGTSMPTVASAGYLYIDLATASYPIAYRSDGSSWVALGANPATYPQMIPDAATPTNPLTGTIWYDANDNKIKAYDGATWQSLW